MQFDLIVVDDRGKVLDVKTLEASGRRLAVKKYLRRYGLPRRFFRVKVIEFDSRQKKLGEYFFQVQVINSTSGTIVKLDKTRKF